MRSSLIFSFFSFTLLFFILHCKNLSTFALPQDAASPIIPSLTQGVNVATATDVDTVTITTTESPSPSPPPLHLSKSKSKPISIITSTHERQVITITSTSTVLPPIAAATHNPNFSGSTSGSSGSINASSNNSDSGPSGLVVGILVVGGIVLLGAISSACYCYRRHRLSLRYDEDDGGEVVLRGGYQDPFQSTLDQYHRTRY
ncbi:hypothetical protein F8M41_020044 [Gigaspora margarita]|uniref:Mid2 domain-containing protein n=1 Tax=Gigaspora margarita TaxID=4874 RepID=A0A8H4EJY6_GIGMA|nr:hypothetical protein F8M41_020044 [Gigaspora margarita]